MLISIMILSGIGFLVSLYMFYVWMRIKGNSNYKSSCDFSEYISCSKSLKSGYTNPVAGALFYVIVGVLGFYKMMTPLLIVTVIGGLGTCVIAYLIYFKVKTLCLPCTAVFIVNGVLLYFVLQMVR